MLRIILLQLLTTVIAALVAWMLVGLPALWSALLGGVCCVVPNALFALRLHVSAQKPGGTNPMTFFFGEFIKIATTFALMGAIVWLYHGVHWLAFLLSFIVVLKSYFILLFRHRP